MTFLKALSTVAVPLVLAASSVAGNTYTVDDDGGPNADFTDIQSAVDAASPGDLIVVERGNYAGFLVDRGVTLLGSEFAPGAVVTGDVTVQGIPANEIVVLTGFHLQQTLGLASSVGTIVVDNVDLLPPNGDLTRGAIVEVTGCTDARFFECVVGAEGRFGWEAHHGISITGSVVEVVSCEVYGRDGFSHDDCWSDAGDAGSAVIVDGTSQGLVFSSLARGGNGGNGPSFCEWSDSYGGDAGQGILGVTGADVMVAGLPVHECIGGFRGYGDDFCQGCHGFPGFSMWMQEGASIRRSGVTTESPLIHPGATDTVPDPADPTLVVVGEHQAGQMLTFRLHGPPGSQGVLYLGRLPERISSPNQYMEQRTSRQRSYPLGTVPANGILEFTFPLPSWMWRGFTFHAQGEVLLQGGERRLTNSAPVVIRKLP